MEVENVQFKEVDYILDTDSLKCNRTQTVIMIAKKTVSVMLNLFGG